MSTSTQQKKDETVEKKVFQPRNVMVLKVGWPSIYPENKTAPFVFRMRIQLVKEAEELQREFLMLADVEQTRERYHEYDVAMLQQLATAPPEGFPDFPKLVDHEGELSAAIREYFMPGDPERKQAMGFILRGVMARYWREVTPADYL